MWEKMKKEKYILIIASNVFFVLLLRAMKIHSVEFNSLFYVYILVNFASVFYICNSLARAGHSVKLVFSIGLFGNLLALALFILFVRPRSQDFEQGG